MEKIYKYPLEDEASQVLNLPRGAQILSVMEQYGRVVLYTQVNPDESQMEQWLVSVRETGQPIDGDLGRFIGTVSLTGGRLMWHIFAKAEHIR